MNRVRQSYKLYVMVILIGLLVLGSINFSFNAIADNPNSDTKIILSSRFILWDANEKMIDNNFHINIYYYNISNNHTANYNIYVDELNFNGTFQYFKSIPINLTNKEIINSIVVKINNETVFNANYILIMEGITGRSVRRGFDEFLISLNPLDWEAKEYNIFFGVIVASIISIFIALKTVKHYRVKRGVREVE